MVLLDAYPNLQLHLDLLANLLAMAAANTTINIETAMKSYTLSQMSNEYVLTTVSFTKGKTSRCCFSQLALCTHSMSIGINTSATFAFFLQNIA
jgi:folylpolyglutamate synthase/dihydropteroate synthase